MTDTILPLTEADVRALGYTPFGYERDDRMGAVLAHKDGEAFYLCRRGAFWSIDPEYSNMRGVLCEVVPNWREFRRHCDPRLIVGTDILVWRVSDLPVERAERLGNYHTIAPVLAGLKAQAEVEYEPKGWAPGQKDADGKLTLPEGIVIPQAGAYGVPIGNGVEHAPLAPAPAPRRPLKLGDKVTPDYLGASDARAVKATRRAVTVEGLHVQQVQLEDDSSEWHVAARMLLILPDAEG